jgi:hypothetical protein
MSKTYHERVRDYAREKLAGGWTGRIEWDRVEDFDFYADGAAGGCPTCGIEGFGEIGLVVPIKPHDRYGQTISSERVELVSNDDLKEYDFGGLVRRLVEDD